jgi:hypothetical protein
MRELKSWRCSRKETDRLTNSMSQRNIDADDIVSVIFLEDIQCYEIWYRSPVPSVPTDTGPV